MEKRLQKGTCIESNTYYKADGLRIDIYPEDCEITTEPVYFPYFSHSIQQARPVGFLLKNLENVTLDFGGATIVFHGEIVPFILDTCKNVKLINFKVDYHRPFYTQARVLECDKTHMRVRMDKDFPCRVENGYLYAVGDGWERNLNKESCLLWLYDRSGIKNYSIILAAFGPEIFPSENPPLPIRHLLVEEEGDTFVFRGDFPEAWDANDENNSLVFSHEPRDKCTITIVNCENIYVENFTLIYGAAYAVMGLHSKNLYFDNYNMYMDFEGNGRLVTNNADGIHLFNCSGDFVFKNSHMEGLLDDTVNVHNNYLRVVEAEENRLVCAFVGASLSLQCPIFAKGDRIALYRGRTQERKAEAEITDVFIDLEKRQFVYSLDRTLAGIDSGDVMENLSGHPEILLENCEFGRFRGTMRLQSRAKTVVRGCKFHNLQESIIFTGDTTYWFESGPVNDFRIENCSFPHTTFCPRILFFGEVEYTEKENYYHKNITVENCTFGKGEVAILNHVDGFVFRNNTADGEMKIRVKESVNVVCDEDVTLL